MKTMSVGKPSPTRMVFIPTLMVFIPTRLLFYTIKLESCGHLSDFFNMRSLLRAPSWNGFFHVQCLYCMQRKGFPLDEFNVKKNSC